MKKRIALLLATVLAVGTLATACGGNSGNNDSTVKVGIGVHTDFAYGSKDFGASNDKDGNPKNGVAQADIHVAAVMLDANGKIIDVVVDAIQIAGEVDATGKIVTDKSTAFQTKREKGTEYGMVKYGSTPIGKEWYEQVDFFESFCIGKTAAEVAAIALEDQTATDSAILAGCTIKVYGIQQAIVRACENAKWEGASATDTLSLGMTGTIYDYNYTYDATPATAEAAAKDGMICASSTIAATTTNKDGKLTCVVIDAIQAKSTFDTTGKITTDMTAEKEPVTKYNQHDKYGMVEWGPKPPEAIGKEWDYQAEFYMNYVLSAGKVAATNDSGKPTDDALLAGCTIVITDMNKAVEKALNPQYGY